MYTCTLHVHVDDCILVHVNCDPTHRTHLVPRGQVVSSPGRSRHWTQGRWTLRPVSIIYRVDLACPRGQTDLPVLDLSAKRKEHV